MCQMVKNQVNCLMYSRIPILTVVQLNRNLEYSSMMDRISRVLQWESSLTNRLNSLILFSLSVMQVISLLASLTATHCIRNFNSSSPLNAPHPHFPVQTFMFSSASIAAPSIPTKALWISLRTPRFEYWQLYEGKLEKSVASMATKTDLLTSLYLCRRYSALNLKESEQPSQWEKRRAPQTMTAQLSSSQGQTSLEMRSYGNMANRISYCTQPFFSTPPPSRLLAKSIMIALPQQSSMARFYSSQNSTLRRGISLSILQTQRQDRSRLQVRWMVMIQSKSCSFFVITFIQVIKQRSLAFRASARAGFNSFCRKVISSPIETTSSWACLGIIPKNIHPTSSRASKRVTLSTLLISGGSMYMLPSLGRWASSSCMSLGRASPQKSSSSMRSRFLIFSVL